MLIKIAEYSAESIACCYAIENIIPSFKGLFIV